MNKLIRVLFIVIALGIYGLSANPVKALSGGTLSQSAQDHLANVTCLGSVIAFSYTATGTADDALGDDHYAIVGLDADGNLVDADVLYLPVGTSILNGVGGLVINTITSRPITVQLVDSGVHLDYVTPDYIGRPVLAQFTIDPADFNPACASLPLVGNSTEEGAPGPTIPTGFVLRTISCDVAVFNAPDGSPVGSNRIRSGQTWYVNPESKQANGKAWTEIFVGGPITGWMPTACVQ
jgi:hypothetical protein